MTGTLDVQNLVAANAITQATGFDVTGATPGSLGAYTPPTYTGVSITAGSRFALLDTASRPSAGYFTLSGDKCLVIFSGVFVPTASGQTGVWVGVEAGDGTSFALPSADALQVFSANGTSDTKSFNIATIMQQATGNYVRPFIYSNNVNLVLKQATITIVRLKK